MGTYYPVRDDPYFDSSECPLFWRHHKIRVVPVNFTNEEYHDNIKIAAMSGMVINIIGVIISSFVLINILPKYKKVYFRALTLIAVPLIDSILDAVYFLHLGNEYILVHMPASVIKLMCAFLFIAALKDILMSWFIKRLHRDGAQLKIEIEHEFKIIAIMICFIGEDLFQVWLQYFYFEKYRFEQTTTFYVNAGNRSFS